MSRAWLALRATWGMALLVAPGRMLRLLGANGDGPAPRRILRVLGARHLLQAAGEYRLGRRGREAGVLVDLTHALTAAIFGWANPRWRRPALTDSTIAVGFAVSGLPARTSRRASE